MATIGIEWVNEYHGHASNLSKNDNNARGFYNELTGTRQFEYADDLAWDQDFEQSGTGTPAAGTDSTYGDNVDIVFFSGHGSSSGISFGIRNKDDGIAKPSNMRLGDKDLEWIVFDACNVLYDSSTNDAVARLGAVFNGLHYMLGFATTCSDVGDRGKKFASKLNSGFRVREAWIQACRETENSSTECAYIRADNGTSDTYNDHWHGQGFVSTDPVNPTSKIYYKTSC